MEPWSVAVLVLAAVVVGAGLPALLQLRTTLRAVELLIKRSGGRLEEALAATASAATRIDALSLKLEQGGRIEQFAEGVEALSRVATQLHDSLRVAGAVGAAVAPAVAAAIHAFRDGRASPENGPRHHPAAAPAPLQPEPERQDRS